MNRRFSTKELTTLAMITAMAYVLVCTVRIPVVLFLKYEPKDVIIAMGGFLLGPKAVVISAGLVALLEMVTISDTGIIGCIMNFLSTCSFCFLAASVYQKRHTISGAVTGLALGSGFMTLVMLLWNYLVTPLYMGVNRQDVAALLLPAFLPFNLLKAGLNSSLTLLLYKPLVTGLRRAGLVPTQDSPSGAKRPGVALLSGLLLVSCILLVLVFRGIL